MLNPDETIVPMKPQQPQALQSPQVAQQIVESSESKAGVRGAVEVVNLPPPEEVEVKKEHKFKISKKAIIIIAAFLIAAFVIYFLLYLYVREIYTVAVQTHLGTKVT